MTTHKIIADERLAIIILAAGASSRLGQSKQLININGECLLERQSNLALSISKHVYCVLGSAADLHRQVIEKKRIKIVVNEQWQEGMSTSISAGIKVLPDHINAAMILLVDQWQLTTTHIEKITEQWLLTPNNIIVAKKSALATKQIGPPVIFPKTYFAQLMELTGEFGAKSVLKKHQKSIKSIEISAAFIDLDTPEQLAEMEASL